MKSFSIDLWSIYFVLEQPDQYMLDANFLYQEINYAQNTQKSWPSWKVVLKNVRTGFRFKFCLCHLLTM